MYVGGYTLEVNILMLNHILVLTSDVRTLYYFDVEKFPISTIVITKVDSVNGKNIKITGNLTIKGVTHAVTFPAVIEVKDGIVKATGKIIIDRTQWGIRYKSGTFYDNLADNAVSDDIEFNMEIVAKK